MNRMIVVLGVLAALNVCSAVAVVYLKHLSRMQYEQITRQQGVLDELDVEWSRVQLEEGAFSELSMVERIAVDRLDMTFPSPEQTRMIVR